MKSKLIAYLLFLTLTGCISEWDRQLDEKKIEPEILSKTNTFSSKNVHLKITEYKEVVTITLDYKLPSNIKLPVDSFFGDTLNETKFYLKLFSDNKPIIVKGNTQGYKGFLNSFVDTNILIIPFTKQKIIPRYHSEVNIPIYVFNSLKAGEHNIAGELFVKSFYGSHYDKDTKETSDIEVESDVIKGNLKFKLDVPEIYLTTIYLDSIILRNDDKFSPLGMDFSFREGYPDIYWEIFYPKSSENDFAYQYWRSPEATNSVAYNYSDTVQLYHYSDKDYLKIGVYDRDDLSRDDFIGMWFGTLDELISNYYKTFKFDNINSVKIKAIKKGCVNK